MKRVYDFYIPKLLYGVTNAKQIINLNGHILNRLIYPNIGKFMYVQNICMKYKERLKRKVSIFLQFCNGYYIQVKIWKKTLSVPKNLICYLYDFFWIRLSRKLLFFHPYITYYIHNTLKSLFLYNVHTYFIIYIGRYCYTRIHYIYNTQFWKSI